ncbi:ERAD-associated E3 ubiquitin-protein ligase hrd1a [Orobanche minor]
MGLVFMCILWQLTKKVFLGSLREAEVERLNEQSWREVMEILFAITIFRQDFSVSFIAMVTALLLIKALHWLAQKRVEYIETTPTVPKLAHIRIISFMGFLLLLDCCFLYNAIKHLLETKQASVSLFFAFEYMILATTTISTFLKYTFYVGDMIMDGQWEKKAVYTFYLELARDLLHLTMYMCFFLVIFVNYGVPLHLIRELYETFRNFKIRVADYIRYRNITSNMNDRFPDATSEELNSSDATCIICREEMTTAKKLLCGHLFHVQCLRSWLERQNTCPTCRAPVVPPENGTTTTGTIADGHQHGTSTTGTSSQGSASVAVANGNISHHQARLQAAASAAAMYQKSFVYPSPSTLVWSPGQTSLPQTFGPMMANDGGEGAASGLPQQYQFPNMTFMQSPQGTFMPSGFEGHNGQYGSASGSQPELHVKLIERHIEVNFYKDSSSFCKREKIMQTSKERQYHRHHIRLSSILVRRATQRPRTNGSIQRLAGPLDPDSMIPSRAPNTRRDETPVF